MRPIRGYLRYLEEFTAELKSHGSLGTKGAKVKLSKIPKKFQKGNFLQKFPRPELFCHIWHIYPPFTRKPIASLCFGRYVRTRLGVTISEVSGPPVFHMKNGASR